MTHSPERLQQLADYYDGHSTADQMDGGDWVDEPVIEPMVTTSLRLPIEVMQAVRERAALEGVRPTALIRRWVEASVVSAQGAADPTLAAIQAELHAMRQLMQARAGGDAEATAPTKKASASRGRATKATPVKATPAKAAKAARVKVAPTARASATVASASKSRDR